MTDSKDLSEPLLSGFEEKVEDEDWRASLVAVETKDEEMSGKKQQHVLLQQFKNVESLYENSIRRLKLTKRETTFEIEKGEDDIATILRSRGNVFQHDASYRTKKWVTHIATLGMNRARRWTIFPGEIGMALYTPTNTVFQLVAGNHYLAPGVYSSARKMTLPTGLEARPIVSYLGRVHIVRVRPGDVVLITVNGIQRVLGTGFHFIEAKNFTFDGKKFLARTNLIQHGNMARVFVPRGCVFTAVVDQQPIVLPHRVQPYLFNTPRFQTPVGRTVTQCFVKIGSQDIEHMSVRIFLVPKGYRVFCKYRGDPLVFEHDPMPYVIDDPLFEWGAKDFLSSRLPLSISYCGLLGLHYIRVPKGQLLLVLINGRVSAIRHDPKLGDVPQIVKSPNLQPIAFVSTAQRFVSCATWNRVLVRCGEVCLAWLKNKAVRLAAREDPHVISDDDCFRLRSLEEEIEDSTIDVTSRQSVRKSAVLDLKLRAFKMAPSASKNKNTFLRSNVPQLLNIPSSAGLMIQPGIGWRPLSNVDVAFKQLCENYHHGPFVQKTVPPGQWGVCRVNAKIEAFLDRFVSDHSGDFRMIGILPAVEQLVELSLRDVRAADHRLDLKVDFIFKIVDAQRALRALIPVKMIQNWKSLLEERAKSVVTSLLPRVQSNLTIRNLDGVDEDGDGEGDRRGTFAENFSNEVKGSWGSQFITKVFQSNGIQLVSFTPSEVHLTDKETRLKLEESARAASLQEMQCQTIRKGFLAQTAQLNADIELEKQRQGLEVMKLENANKLKVKQLEMQQKLQEEKARLAVQMADSDAKQSKIRADAQSYAATAAQKSGAYTPQQLEIEKLKIVSQCFANTTYTGPEMAMQHRMLVGSMLNNMGMSGLMPQFVQNGGGVEKKLKKGQALRGGISSKRVS